ncbi:MAG: circularly permuted type 2 ATP-grasp protein, partial [Ectothiorhodospiraceae bacterium]
RRFAAQQHERFASVPALGSGGLEPRSAVLRTFMVARADGYAAMPGGLTRVTPAPEARDTSNQAGGLSKDTWVVASEPIREVSLIAGESGDDTPADRSAALPPAATENLFWLARYAERAEHGLRLMRLVMGLLRDAPEGATAADRHCRARFLQALTRVTHTAPGFLEGGPGRMDDPLPELRSVLRDPGRTGSVAFNLQAMLAASHAVRDRLSRDSWRVLGSIRAHLGEGDGGEPGPELDELVTLLAALRGLLDDTMVHSQAWSFLELGRCLERGLLTSRLLRATVTDGREPGQDAAILEAVLHALESVNAFRRQYHEGAQARPVLQLVLFSESNPRAVGYQLARLKRTLKLLPNAGAQEQLSPEQQLVLEANTALRLANPDTLAATGERHELDALLERVARLLDRAARSLGAAYFSDPVGPRQLGPTRPGPREGS